MTVRILAPAPSVAPGQTERDILERVLAWLRAPGEVTSLVLHAPGAHLTAPDGRDLVVDGRGQLRDVAAAVVATC